MTVVTLLLLVAVLFVGCASNKNQKKLTVNTIAATEGVNGLKADQLKQIADMLASVCTTDYDTQEMLVAASRGYDMTAEGFNDAVGEYPDVGVNLEAARNVITQANAKAGGVVTFDYGALNEADVETIVNSFKVTVDTAAKGNFLDTLLTGIGAVLRWLTNTLGFGNYLIGICVFAIIIEILMLPFAIKQQKNSIRQATLRPKEMAIRNKYKGRNDQATMQKMQQEIQEFYQRENFSPYSGCLPLLVQLPIIMALYYIVIDPLHYVMGQASGTSAALASYYTAARAAGGMGATVTQANGTIAILAELKAQGGAMLEGLKSFEFFGNGEAVFSSVNAIMDKIPNFNIGPINFGLNPSFGKPYILLLVPVLTFVTYFLTSKLNRKFMAQPVTNGGVEDKQVACSNTMMDVSMPLMSTFFTFMVPALVGVYWMFRSLVGLLKQFIMSRIMPLPKFTEEDYKQAAKEMAGKQRPVKKSENAGKVRSLHHIDDEDFEDTRERALARKAAIEERERREREEKEKGKKRLFEAAGLKEENKRQGEKETAAEDTDENDKNQNSNQE